MAGDAARPTREQLLALPTDDWSVLLATALPIVRGLPDRDRDALVKRLVAVPLGRLVSGRAREDLTGVLLRPTVWPLVAAALGDGPRPWVTVGDPVEQAQLQTRAEELAAELRAARSRIDELERRESTARERLVAVREERDAAQRSAQGATVRAELAERQRTEAADAVAASSAELETLRRAVADADAERRRAVEREQRRRDADDGRLREELTAARRMIEELRTALAAAQRRPAATASAAVALPAAEPVTGRGTVGRPSRLPDGMVPGTKEAAEWLVTDPRELLVDGYNVTLTNRPHLSLQDQRRWLEAGVAALVQRRHVRATIVWDAAMGVGSTTSPRRGVQVRYTTAEMTADDELDLHVRSMLDPDQPCVVVTDDVGLRDRLRPHGVDLLDSRSFTWLL